MKGIFETFSHFPCVAFHDAFKTCFMVDLQACAFFDILTFLLLLF